MDGRSPWKLIACLLWLTFVIQVLGRVQPTKKPSTKTKTTITTENANANSKSSKTRTTTSNPAAVEVASTERTVIQNGKCVPPSWISPVNGTADDAFSNWDEINEVKFMAESEIYSQGKRKLLCKLKCIEGQWVGPLCTEDEANGRYQPLLKGCHLNVPNDTNLILSFHDHHKPLDPCSNVSVPHGTLLLARCAKLGLMKLLGVPSIQCRDGSWTQKLPSCLMTSPSTTNFTDEYPPAIIINVPAGAAAENAAGELIVRPKSILHFDCVFWRKIGRPSWSWVGTDPGRQYPTGWAMSQDERNWRYRISIYYAQNRDAGTFTCATPMGYSNSITIVIKTIECDALPEVLNPLQVEMEGRFAGQTAKYSCTRGYILRGSPSITCLASGQWSGSPPSCELILCPLDLEGIDRRLEFEVSSNSFQGTVTFHCPFGYRMHGSPTATCTESMVWYPPPPICEAIQCPPPLPPLNGRFVDSGSHFVGDQIDYSCNKNFVLIGENLLTCTENGTWSSPEPYCQLSCPHPGLPVFGEISPDLQHYEIGSRVSVTCHDGKILQGRPWLICQQDGMWSSPVGYCA